MAGRSTVTASPLYIGCAGWSLPRAYQAEFPGEGSHLERYARIFSAVEINSSFYRPHRPDTYARWRDAVPDHFRFSVKVPREMTHIRRLRECEVPMASFMNEAGRLEEKLGCLLVQLPPSLAYDEPAATRFFRVLREYGDMPVACEPRHFSWFSPEATALLDELNIARVEADPPPVPAAGPEPEVSLAYVRLHGSPEMYYSSYSVAALDRFANRLDELQKRRQAVWCVFDNTANGASIENGLYLMKAYVGQSEMQMAARQKAYGRT